MPVIYESLLIDGLAVNRVSTCKFLGVILDENLSWTHHIASICRKLAKYVPIMSNIRAICTTTSLKLIYNCLIYSNLIYCNSVWGHCKGVAINPLIIMHKKIVRSIIGARFDAHTNEIFRDLSFLKMPSINEYFVAILVYKSLNDEEFGSWFTRRESNFATRWDATCPSLIPVIRNKHSEQCIIYRGPIIYNAVPSEFRQLSYDSFKIEFKRILLLRQSLG